MTREEAKQLLPIIKAFSEGKTIQQLSADDNNWVDIVNSIGFIRDTKSYRIKPEPKYRPFKDAEECWQEMLKHQPFGWVMKKGDKSKMLITAVDEKCSINSDRARNSFYYIMTYYTFADGSAFGIKEEE